MPYITGYHPDRSLVVVARDGHHIGMLLRADLPSDDPDDPSGRQYFTDLADAVVEHCRVHEFAAVLLLGYGDADPVRTAVTTVGAMIQAAGLDVGPGIRIDAGTAHVLDDAGEPVEAFPIEPARSTVAAAQHGRVVHASRDAVSALVAPVTGAARAAMDAAATAARDRLAALRAGFLAGGGTDDHVAAMEAMLRDAGAAAVRAARQQAGVGTALSDQDLAWLVLLLGADAVVDDVLPGCDGSPAEVALWQRVTCRADPDLAAPPACLLALNAYLAGQDALAIAALERAHAIEPEFVLLGLVRQTQQLGVDRNALRDFLSGR